MKRPVRQSARRSLRGRRARGHGGHGASYAALLGAATSAAAGFDLCARKTREETIAVAATNAAAALRALVALMSDVQAGNAGEGRPRARMSERLRWEWLASTALLVDGATEARLLSECARILGDATSSTRSDGIDAEIGARFRVASAEAYSLAHAAENERRTTRRDLLLALP